MNSKKCFKTAVVLISALLICALFAGCGLSIEKIGSIFPGPKDSGGIKKATPQEKIEEVIKVEPRDENEELSLADLILSKVSVTVLADHGSSWDVHIKAPDMQKIFEGLTVNLDENSDVDVYYEQLEQLQYSIRDTLISGNFEYIETETTIQVSDGEPVADGIFVNAVYGGLFDVLEMYQEQYSMEAES